MNASVPARGVKSLLKTIILVPAVWVWMVISYFASRIFDLIPGFNSWMFAQSSSAVILVLILVLSTSLVTCVFGVWLFQCVFDKKPFALLGFIPDKKMFPSLILGMLSSAVIVTVVVRTLDHLELIKQRNPIISGSAPLLEDVLGILLFSFVFHHIGEELLFRGYLMQRFACTLKPQMAVFASAVASVVPYFYLIRVDGGGMVPKESVYVATLFGLALLAGALVYRTGSLWAAIGINGGFHASELMLIEKDYPVEGNLMALSLGAVYMVIAVLLLVFLPRRVGNQVQDTADAK